MMSLESWRAPSVERREGGIEGVGLFATENIGEGELLAIRGGQLIDGETLRSNMSIIRGTHHQVAPDLFMAGLTPEDAKNSLVGINHRCDPNAFVDGQITVRSMRAIEEGEEVTLDYATTYCTETQSFDCQCGSDECRGRVGPADAWDSDLRKKYDGYFADFLARPEAYEGVNLRPVDPDVAVTSWLSEKAKQVEDSDIHSIGLVATDYIRTGELLAVKGGRLVTADEVMKNADTIQGSEVQLPGDMFMAGLTQEERLAALLGFNHRCLIPNSILRRQISIFALTDISPGEELTEEYATAFSGPSQRFDCSCGSPHCRGRVDTSVDWQDPEIRKVFDGLFADHVQELIDTEVTV